jgi:hypothetical protein
MFRQTLPKQASFIAIIVALGLMTGWSQPVFGKSHSLTITSGLQNETFTSDEGEDVTRMALGAIGAEYELNLSDKLSLGILGGAQVSFVSQETLSFGLGGFLNYFFKGSPNKSTFKTDTAVLSGSNRWAYFVGTGFEERFIKSSELDSEIRGGPFIRFGGRYIWNSEIFMTGNFKYLLGGAEYNSIDITFGIGFFL